MYIQQARLRPLHQTRTRPIPRGNNPDDQRKPPERYMPGCITGVPEYERKEVEEEAEPGISHTFLLLFIFCSNIVPRFVGSVQPNLFSHLHK
jgi:hypothetical protein